MPIDPKDDLRKAWREEERAKQKAEKINKAREAASARTGDVYSDITPEEVAAQSDWDKLVETAKLKFPEHLAAKFNITPAQRTAAIAHSIGWTYDKIAKASGYATSTVSKWFAKEPVQEFVKAFEYHTGSRDTKDMLDGEMYATLQTVVQIRDDLSVSASTRMDAAKWLWEAKHGKAKESREIKGINLRDLTQQISRATRENDLDNVLLPPSKPSTN